MQRCGGTIVASRTPVLCWTLWVPPLGGRTPGGCRNHWTTRPAPSRLALQNRLRPCVRGFKSSRDRAPAATQCTTCPGHASSVPSSGCAQCFVSPVSLPTCTRHSAIPSDELRRARTYNRIWWRCPCMRRLHARMWKYSWRPVAPGGAPPSMHGQGWEE